MPVLEHNWSTCIKNVEHCSQYNCRYGTIEATWRILDDAGGVRLQHIHGGWVTRKKNERAFPLLVGEKKILG